LISMGAVSGYRQVFCCGVAMYDLSISRMIGTGIAVEGKCYACYGFCIGFSVCDALCLSVR